MAKPEWGIKRICQSCGARYYDFHKTQIVCPKCQTVFDPEAVLKSRRVRTPVSDEPKKKPPREKARADDEDEAEDTEDEDAEEETEDLVDEPELETGEEEEDETGVPPRAVTDDDDVNDDDTVLDDDDDDDGIDRDVALPDGEEDGNR